MSGIAKNFHKILSEVAPTGATLVVVSKTHPSYKIQEVYDEGHRDFGENKVQELVDKYAELPKDIQWHLIGHLQRNKVKYIAPFVHLIHAVDSERLMHEIEKQAAKNKRIINVLLQAKIAAEDTKFGLSFDEVSSILVKKEEWKQVNIKGLMGMATNTTNEDQVKREFTSLAALFKHLKANHPQLDTLSMGMTQDYSLATACGSNLVRIGSAIFGERGY